MQLNDRFDSIIEQVRTVQALVAEQTLTAAPASGTAQTKASVPADRPRFRVADSLKAADIKRAFSDLLSYHVARCGLRSDQEIITGMYSVINTVNGLASVELLKLVARVCYPEDLPVERITSQPKTIERYARLTEAVKKFDQTGA